MILVVRRTLARAHAPARASCLARGSYSHSYSRRFSARSAERSSYSRSDFSGQGYTSVYEQDQPTRGPLSGASSLGQSHITPKALRQHLDEFVVDQDRAKVVLSVAVHEHHLRIQENQRRRDEATRLEAQALRRESAYRHAVEDECPGQQAPVDPYSHSEAEYHQPALYGSSPPLRPEPEPPLRPEPEPLLDTSEHQVQLEKSNVMIFGPTGVGKTLMCKTLAKTLGIPIAMSDCTAFTQAGYIGDDVESCVARLLSAANYDIEAAEQGIIVLDEIDKIAGAKIVYGKDVGGEGVQQALLKIIEGTTVQVQAKQEKSAGKGPAGTSGRGGPYDGPASSENRSPPTPSGGKGEVYNVRTDNILFICTGAFAKLHKIVIDRKAAVGMGFGASIRSSNAQAAADGVMLKGADAARFKQDMPFFVRHEPEKPGPFGAKQKRNEEKVNVLDYVQPADLRKFGLIPELIGRIPTTCAVAALDEEALVRVLTEPKHSLVRQEEYKFSLRNIELRFTQPALREIARKASKMGTGARGLRHVVDSLLLDTKYETPGTTVKHILVTQDAALLKCAPLYFHRGQDAAFRAALLQEDEKWEQQFQCKDDADSEQISSFEEYRKAGAAGA